MNRPPGEPPGGQDQDPDVRTAVAALLVLLDDVRLFLRTHHDHAPAAELLLRVEAHRSALTRLRHALERGPR